MAYPASGASWFGPDYWTNGSSPRNSVRLTSTETFSNVLIIAEFDFVPGSYLFPSLLFSFIVIRSNPFSGFAPLGPHSGQPISPIGRMVGKSTSTRASTIKKSITIPSMLAEPVLKRTRRSRARLRLPTATSMPLGNPTMPDVVAGLPQPRPTAMG